MRLRAIAASVVLLMGVAATAATTAQAAVSPRPSFTAFTVEGAVGADLLATGYREFVDSALHATATAHGLVMFHDLGGWQVTVGAPNGTQLHVGNYPTDAAVDAGVVQLTIGGEGGTCSVGTGTLQVHDVAYDPTTQVLTSLAATYTTHCNNVQPVTVGEIRFQSSVDYARFGSAPLGTSSAPQTVTVTATAPTTFGTAALEGLNADQWSQGTDSCSGKTLTAGATCAVVLTARPTHEGGLSADLRLASASGDRVTSLTAVGVNTALGAFKSLPPTRLLDTRTGLGAPRSPVGSGLTIDVTMAGRASIPVLGVSSVVLNVTIVGPTRPGYVTIYPGRTTKPETSSINFAAGWTGANLVTVPLGADGHVRFYNAIGSTQILADVVGYYLSATSTADPTAAGLGDYYAESTPWRAVDTRKGGDAGQLPGGYYFVVGLDYPDYPGFNERIKAFAVNVTVVSPQAAGYLTTWNGVGNPPTTTSTLNFTKGKVIANMATIPAGKCTDKCGSPVPLPSIGVYNASSAPAHILVDVVGYYYVGYEGNRAWRYQPLPTPTRIADSRHGLGLSGALGPKTSQAVAAPSSVAGYNTYAIVSNVTAVLPSKETYLTLWRNDGTTTPEVSNLNAGPGQVVANMAITGVWDNNDVRIQNDAGTTNVIVDAAGTMEHYPALVVPPGAKRAVAAAAADRGAASRAGRALPPVMHP